MAEQKESLLQFLDEAVRILARLLPQKTYLYFPLIYNSLVWIAQRPKEWKEKIFSWQVWPDPEPLLQKPDEFVISFFENDPGLNKAFREEVGKKDLKVLRKAFSSLYTLFGLEDPFLLALFDEEIKAGQYRKITQVFNGRVEQAKEDIVPLMKKAGGFDAFFKLSEEAVSLGNFLLSRSEVKKSVEKILKEQLSEGDE
jgi:hypothetical protein